MNHEATIATLNAQLNNCAKDLYEKDKRIAELERENARLDAALDGEISCRDHYHEWADKLAAEISRYFGVDIGEHSNANNPWEQAYEAVPAAPAVEQVQNESLREGVTILDDMIDSIRRHGNYTKESTLNFLNQLRQCIALPSALPDDAPAWAHRIRERDAKTAAPQAADTDKAREAIPDGCALSWNGTIYHGISEIYHQMEEGAALHMVLDEKSVPRADKDGCVYSLVGRVEQYVAASMAAQAPVREVPGYKLVPLEVTDAMLEAWKTELCVPIGSSPEAKARRAYRAMLAAAPVQQEGGL